MSDLVKFLIKAYLRKLLAIVGTFLVTHKLYTGTSDAFVNQYLDSIVGFLLLGVSAGWTFLYQAYVKRKVLAAKKLSPDASKEELEKAAELG